jgi:GH15 family glucan-1,4-alpha-glucosidase
LNKTAQNSFSLDISKEAEGLAKSPGNRFLKGTVVGTFLGVLATLTYQYFRNILKQPRLASKAVVSDVQDFDTQEARALFILVENLHAGISERKLNNQDQKLIVHAGYRNFRESWARDFGFATYGLLALESYQPVKGTLEAFFWNQTPQGQFPVKLQSMSLFSRFMHSLFGREQSLENHLTPKYITGHRTVSLDGQALIVLAACNYIRKTKDYEFANQNWDALQKGIRWLRLSVQQDGVSLYQQAYADWADSVARKGVVFYTNMVYWKALREMANLAADLGYDGEVNFYRQMAQDLKNDLNQELWQPKMGYFATSLEMDNLSSAGNLLAVAWGFANDEQAHSILNAIQAFDMANPVPTQAAHPPYEQSQISIENRLGLMSNYHTEGAWLWIGAWHVIALCKMERKEEAHRLLTRLLKVITQNQQVHEVYGLDSQPLSSFWYTSEAPLIWNAAMVIYAFQTAEDCFQKQ